MTPSRRRFMISAAAVGIGMGLEVRAAERAPGGMKIAILGDSSCIPDVGRETACYLITDVLQTAI